MQATTKTTKSNGEYRVRLFVDGEYQPGADYFTDDIDDAKETAARMVEQCTHNVNEETEVSDEVRKIRESEMADYKAEAGEKLVVYDVCNDYTLDPANISIEDIDLDAYSEWYVAQGTIYKHKEYKEIHYFVGPAGCDGERLGNMV